MTGQPVERLSLRTAATNPKPGLHVHRDLRAGAGHVRECGDLRVCGMRRLSGRCPTGIRLAWRAFSKAFLVARSATFPTPTMSDWKARNVSFLFLRCLPGLGLRAEHAFGSGTGESRARDGGILSHGSASHR